MEGILREISAAGATLFKNPAMQEYDVDFKLLLRTSGRTAIRNLTGTEVIRWLDVELPKVQNLRLDLLGETQDDSLVHIEIQSSNDVNMPLRMAEYCLAVLRLHGRLPRQFLAYVGQAPLTMPHELRGPDVHFRYHALDIRQLDGETLLASGQMGDNMIALLAGVKDPGGALHGITEKIVELPPLSRETAFVILYHLVRLRGLEEALQREVERMRILMDIQNDVILGPVYREAREKGRDEGRQEGRQEGERILLRRQIEARFGKLPEWAEARLAGRRASEIEEIGVRILSAASLEELLN